MSSSDQYKRQIMNDLAQGTTESLGDSDMGSDLQYENFDDFANRSSTEERRQLFGQSLHHDRIPPGQLEPELQKAIAQIKPNERDDVARAAAIAELYVAEPVMYEPEMIVQGQAAISEVAGKLLAQFGPALKDLA